MTAISATELELLECFGTEPRRVDPDLPWFHNKATYSIELDGLAISYTIHPSFRDISLIVYRGKDRFYELNAVGVVDVRIPHIWGYDVVEILLTECEGLRLQLSPSVSIAQKLVDPVLSCGELDLPWTRLGGLGA